MTSLVLVAGQAINCAIFINNGTRKNIVWDSERILAIKYSTTRTLYNSSAMLVSIESIVGLELVHSVDALTHNASRAHSSYFILFDCHNLYLQIAVLNMYCIYNRNSRESPHISST